MPRSEVLRFHPNVHGHPAALKIEILNRLSFNSTWSNGCLVWTGSMFSSGYGRVKARKTHLAHRLAYQILFGNIPSHLQVCHRCDNPPCFNPDHLFLGTAQENHNDAVTKGRKISGNFLCPKGHIKDKPRKGRRSGLRCGTCSSESAKRWNKILKERRAKASI